jgi:hypothetical protein
MLHVDVSKQTNAPRFQLASFRIRYPRPRFVDQPDGKRVARPVPPALLGEGQDRLSDGKPMSNSVAISPTAKKPPFSDGQFSDARLINSILVSGGWALGNGREPLVNSRTNILSRCCGRWNASVMMLILCVVVNQFIPHYSNSARLPQQHIVKPEKQNMVDSQVMSAPPFLLRSYLKTPHARV